MAVVSHCVLTAIFLEAGLFALGTKNKCMGGEQKRANSTVL
jgi:hypothetical protein